jgi:hypothetical protein
MNIHTDFLEDYKVKEETTASQCFKDLKPTVRIVLERFRSISEMFSCRIVTQITLLEVVAELQVR